MSATIMSGHVYPPGARWREDRGTVTERKLGVGPGATGAVASFYYTIYAKQLGARPHRAVVACSAPPSSGSSSPARAAGTGGRCLNGSRADDGAGSGRLVVDDSGLPNYGNGSVGSPAVLGRADKVANCRVGESIKGHRPGEPPD